MILWVLLGITIQPDSANLHSIGIYSSMDDCFSAREVVMTQLPKPKMDYELVCVKTNKLTGI